MKRFTEPLCWTVGFLVLFVWVLVATEVKEDTGYKSAAKAGAEVTAAHAAGEPAAAEEKHAAAEKKPAAAEKKHAAAEKKPAVAEKKHAAVEKKPAEAEKKHVAAEKKPAAAEKKPAAAEKKPVAAEEKPAAAEKSASGGGAVADVIPMNNAAYKKHKKGICVFTHKKHVVEYKINCGDCHHDKDGKPLKNLKMGDEVQNCVECHKIGGKAKAPKGEKWSKVKKREYHADALHDSCIPCHKRHNKENKTKAAPASCKGCHPKAKKK